MYDDIWNDVDNLVQMLSAFKVNYPGLEEIVEEPLNTLLILLSGKFTESAKMKAVDDLMVLRAFCHKAKVSSPDVHLRLTQIEDQCSKLLGPTKIEE